jgi:hypothetical protein
MPTSLIGIVTRLGTRWLRNRGLCLDRDKRYSSSPKSSAGYVAHPPVQWLPGTLFLGIKLQAHEAVHSPATSAEVNSEWHCTSMPSCCVQRCLLLHLLYFTLLYCCVFPHTSYPKEVVH